MAWGFVTWCLNIFIRSCPCFKIELIKNIYTKSSFKITTRKELLGSDFLKFTQEKERQFGLGFLMICGLIQEFDWFWALFFLMHSLTLTNIMFNQTI